MLELHQLYTVAVFKLTFENDREGLEMGTKGEHIVRLIVMLNTFASSG